MIKKLLFLIITLIPFQLFAYDCWVDGIYYDLNSTTKTASVTNKTGDIYFGGHYSGVISIPEEIEYNGVKYSVTSIGSYAFTKCRNLISITIPNSVTEIGSSAFDGCSTLTSVTIPNSVTSIGSRAFEVCSGLTSVTIPNSVSEIGDKAFDGCTSIKEVKIEDGESVLKMGYSTYTRGLFGSCPLEKVYIGRNLSYNTRSVDGFSPFYNQKNLTEVTIGNSVTEISDYALDGCSSLTSIIIPISVTSIGDDAFRNCSGLISVTIPNSVTSIGTAAFSGCSGLTSVTIPNSVTEIGTWAFSGCSSLTSVTIPNSVTSIGAVAFEGCSSLEKIEINDLKSWCNISFESQNANPLYYVHHLYLGDTEITELIIPNSVTSIGNYAFVGCSSIKEVKIEDGESVLKLGTNYWYVGLFGSCPLEKVYIGRNLTYNTEYLYGYSPFANQKNLTEVTIGNYVTEIGEYAFYGCDDLKTIFYTPTDKMASFYNNTFQGNYSKTTVCCNSPEKTMELVFDNNWSRFAKIYYVNEDKKYVPTLWDTALEAKNIEYADENGCLSELGKEINLKCKTDEKVIAWLGKNLIPELSSPNGYTMIPNEIWKLNVLKNDGFISDLARVINLTQAGELFNELGLQDIQKIEYLKIIGDINGTDVMTFNRITELKFLDLSGANIVEGGQTYRDNLKTSNDVVGSYFFYECDNLVGLMMPNTAKKIDTKALYNQSLLESATIGNSVTLIGNEAFRGCSSLTSITIPNSVIEIGQLAFSGCSGLTSVTLGNSISEIGQSAFTDCNGLTKVTIHDLLSWCCIYFKTTHSNPLYYAHHLYIGDTEITEITLPNSMKVIGFAAFVGGSSLTSLTIPNSVTQISNCAFDDCSSLKEVIIEDGKKELYLGHNQSSSSGLFGSCPLKKIYMGRTLSYDTSSSSGYSPFANQTGLKEVIIGNPVSSIGKYAFYRCRNLTSITIPNSVLEISNFAFEGCTLLQEVVFEDGAEDLKLGYNSASSGLFGSCMLKKVYIGRNLSYSVGPSYGYSPFANQFYLTEVTIGNYIRYIGEEAFYGCSNMTSLTIGNNVASILNCAFEGCSSLTSVTIPNSVTRIGRSAFSYCTQIKEVILGSHLKEIGSYGFAYCPNISKIYSLNATPPEIDTSVFADVDKESCQLVVTKGNLVYYWLDPVWKEFLNMNDNLFYLNPLPTVKYGADPVDLSKYAPEGYSFKYETSNSNVAKIDGSILTIVGAGQATIGASYDETGTQMEIMGQMRQFNVDKTDLEIGVENIIINKGEEIPEFELTAKGLVYNETLEDIGELPVASTDATSSSEPGRYTIYLTGGESRNYNLELIPGTLTIIYKDEADVEEIIEDLFSEEETNLIRIFNLEGILIYDGPETEMSLSNLNKGIYVIVKGNTSKKIMIK